MDQLHSPIKGRGGHNASQKTQAKGPWILAFLAVVALVGFLSFSYLTAQKDQKQVVALNDALNDSLNDTGHDGQDSSRIKRLDNRQENGLDLTHVKPLSPLMPEDGEGGHGSELAFQPQPAPENHVSDWLPMPELVEKSAFGNLPRISSTGLRPLDIYSQSSGTIGANRIAIIVGGLGISQTGTQAAIKALPSSVTLGFSPFGNSLQRWMQVARKAGHEVVLQLPMEPLGYPAVNPGPRTLTAQAGGAKNLENLRWALGRMTNYPLVMNYLGGGMVHDAAVMRPILQEIQQRGLGFLDDGSIHASQMVDLARDMRLPHVQGNMIVDSERKAQGIRQRLKSLESLSRQRGFAIASATAFPETVATIAEWVKQAEKRDILIVPVSNLIKDYTQ